MPLKLTTCKHTGTYLKYSKLIILCVTALTLCEQKIWGSSNIVCCCTEKKGVIIVLSVQQHFCKELRMMLRSEATMKTLFCLLIVPSNFCLRHVSFSYKYFYFFSCSFGGSEASGMIQNYELKSNVLLHTYHPNHQRNQMFISSAYVKRS